MNRIVFFILAGLMILTSFNAYSQPGKIPPFQIIQSNGRVFKAENLPFGKPIVIIYFSPDCEDCQQFTKELLNRINEFNNASIAMITYLSLNTVKQFVSDYHLDKYSNIYIGTEGNSYFVGNYYKVAKLPFLALYNKNGDLIKVYNYNKEENLDNFLLLLRSL
jgi:thiol-disulfide isomerase/thioredoxin